MSLMQKIHVYLRRTQMSETRFGRRAVNDPRLLGDMRNGRELRPATVARIEAFLASERPR
jgi:hypothetical protein